MLGLMHMKGRRGAGPTSMSKSLFFDDVEPGERHTCDSHRIDKAHMLAFAREWDPMPIHVDEAAGKAAFGSIIASGLYVLAIKHRLLRTSPINADAVIVSFGYDEVRFLKPVRPGDTLTLTMECVDKRASRSRPDAGIVTVRIELANQDGEVVMSHLDTVLLRKREVAQDNDEPGA
jgi:acyl dehydratase